jgi:pimeloyl-ACP methyl ester carboxylesterase
MLEYTEKVPVAIRLHLTGRPASYECALRSLSVPTLVMQGMLDPVNTPAMATYTVSQVTGAQLVAYSDLAHMPFWESPQQFNDDLTRFVRQRVLAQL